MCGDQFQEPRLREHDAGRSSKVSAIIQTPSIHKLAAPHLPYRLEGVVHRAGDSLAVSVRARYQRSVRAIGEMVSLVRALDETVVEEVRGDLRAISETLDRLFVRAARVRLGWRPDEGAGMQKRLGNVR